MPGLLYQHMDAGRNVDTQARAPGARARAPCPRSAACDLTRAGAGTAWIGLGARGRFAEGVPVPRNEGSFLEAGFLGRRDDLGRVDCVCGPIATGLIIVGGRASSVVLGRDS